MKVSQYTLNNEIGNNWLTGTSLPLVPGRDKSGPYSACGRMGQKRRRRCRGPIDRARLDERSNVESLFRSCPYRRL
ncbi:MAG TPA: hypothetical protein VKU38_15780 [Ktedonobacteraceae bacterium]|nr:hypothetical protein [Ktedonobacteraceae bacterium]